MKKILVASVVAAGLLGSAGAFAANKNICTGGATVTAGAVPDFGTAGTHFMVTAIRPPCSANVRLSGEDVANGSAYAVSSASAKGQNVFGGHTNGGAILSTGACATKGNCLQTDVNTSLGTMVTAAATAS